MFFHILFQQRFWITLTCGSSPVSQGNWHQRRVIYARHRLRREELWRPIRVGLHLTATPPSAGRVMASYMRWSTSDHDNAFGGRVMAVYMHWSTSGRNMPSAEELPVVSAWVYNWKFDAYSRCKLKNQR